MVEFPQIEFAIDDEYIHVIEPYDGVTVCNKNPENMRGQSIYDFDTALEIVNCPVCAERLRKLYAENYSEAFPKWERMVSFARYLESLLDRGYVVTDKHGVLIHYVEFVDLDYQEIIIDDESFPFSAEEPDDMLDIEEIDKWEKSLKVYKEVQL